MNSREPFKPAGVLVFRAHVLFAFMLRGGNKIQEGQNRPHKKGQETGTNQGQKVPNAQQKQRQRARE